jgi:CubicO group peptidase (beta-lactamase class C family)
MEQRRPARRAFSPQPAFPKTTFRYSNGGYAVAAAVAERAATEGYEPLIQSRLFGPLGVRAVAGWPAFADVHQPWGHYETKHGVKPHDPHDKFQLPAPLIPAGGMSVTAGDYAKFLQLHLRGLQGRDGVLKAGRSSGCTPGSTRRWPWWGDRARGVTASVHSGSAGTFYAVVALWPSRDLGVAVFANSGGDRAAAACKEILKVMAHRYER